MIVGDALVIGQSGETATILAIGDVLETDTVYAEKGGKRISGVWNSTRDGFEISPIREYGTWTLTAKRSGKSDIIRSILIDAAEEFTVNCYHSLVLFDNGIMTVPLKLYALTGTLINSGAAIESRYTRGQEIGSYESYAEQIIVTTNKIDVTPYRKICCQYTNHVYPRLVAYLYNATSHILPINTRGGLRGDLTLIGDQIAHENGTFTDEVDISSITGNLFLYVRTATNANKGGGSNISTDFLKIWLE